MDLETRNIQAQITAKIDDKELINLLKTDPRKSAVTLNSEMSWNYKEKCSVNTKK